jgi:hypothetical protein
MPHPNIDLDDDARLPFMKSPYGVADEDDPAEGDEDEMDHPTALEHMQDAIPPDAIELGCLEPRCLRCRCAVRHRGSHTDRFWRTIRR